ncbi:hypothetical protein NE237_030735 [Protea cynaroides]|uniref:Homeobox domain-containing protein n=1 Tax=Protea cynaroides TaxID=273540 RepID=A0A9Q0GWI4_9MAGN|nr:hypothetical protein NE237_030735 [Protea cynaroides]
MRDLDINQVPSGGEEEWVMMGSAEDEEECGRGPPRKKLRLTKEQSCLLRESFRENHTLNPKQKETLALQLKLKPRQVEVWFQNRRARSHGVRVPQVRWRATIGFIQATAHFGYSLQSWVGNAYKIDGYSSGETRTMWT